MSPDAELALIEPNTEIIQCTVCDEVIWKHRTDPITVRMSVPSQPWPTGEPITAMMEAANDMHFKTVLLPAEEACRGHMKERHPIRFWLWERYGWDRVLRKWFR